MPTDYDPRALYPGDGPWAHRTWDLDDLVESGEVETWGPYATLIDPSPRPLVRAFPGDLVAITGMDQDGPRIIGQTTVTWPTPGPGYIWSDDQGIAFPADLGYRVVPGGYDHAATWARML